MRILTIVSDLRPGGTQRVARNFAIGYRLAGVESALFAYRGGGALEGSLREGNVDVIIGAVGDVAQRDAFRAALAWKPDVIHIHREGPRDSRTGAMLRAARSSTRAGTSRRIGVLETNVFGRVDYSPDRHCIDVHLLLSKWCLWKWQQWGQSLRPAPFGVVLPNLVMHADFSPVSAAMRTEARRQYGIPENALLFGRIGSPNSSKWSAIILKAFSEYGRGNSAAWLLLVGVPDDVRSAVQALPMSLRRRVVLIDFLNGDDALRRAYTSMDVFLHASRIGESFGMVLAESLSCGTPIITLSTPAKDNSQLEIVGHEHGGLVVASLAGFVEAMGRLEDLALRQRYAVQGAARIAEAFGPATLVPRALEIAHLAAAGLSRLELARRVLAMPAICAEVSVEEIRSLMQNCIGQYPAGTPALLRLVSNPLVYRTYRALTRRTA
jgi:glycosyltransferase involved in cell wall biosynthesis